MLVKCESRQTKPAAFLTFIPHHKMHPILGNWKGQSANFPVHPINTPQFVTTTWLWNVHLSSSEKIALHTYFLRNNTKRWQAKFCCGNYNECAKKIRLYIFKYRSLANRRISTCAYKAKIFESFQPNKISRCIRSIQLPLDCGIKILLRNASSFFSSNVNECRKWMRST